MLTIQIEKYSRQIITLLPAARQSKEYNSKVKFIT